MSRAAPDRSSVSEFIERERQEIDRIDSQILRLLNERTEIALRIGKRKRQADLPIKCLSREKAIVERAVQANSGPLPEEAIERIFARIIEESRTIEELDDTNNSSDDQS